MTCVHTLYLDSAFDLSTTYNKNQLKLWLLSAYSINRSEANTVLVCNARAEKYLIDKLKIPYDHVVRELDILDPYPKELWTLCKLVSFGLMEKPLIHIDGDVLFLDRNYIKDLTGDFRVLVEFENEWPNAAGTALLSCLKSFYNPPWLNDYISSLNGLYTDFNAGIVGSTDPKILNAFANFAFDYAITNLSNFAQFNYFDDHASMVIDQFLLRAYLKHINADVTLTRSKRTYDLGLSTEEKILHFYGRGGKTCPGFFSWIKQCETMFPDHCREIDSW